MRTLTKIILFILVLGLAKLNTYTKSPHLSPAESHVLRTITYGVGGGLLVNTVCGMAAPGLDPEIPDSDSFMSCAPFGLAGTVIVTRAYVFMSGGWGMEQWWYANQLPLRVENSLRDLLGWEQRSLPVKPVRRVKGGPVQAEALAEEAAGSGGEL